MIDEKPIANTITYEIHPSIGIARLGNSDSYFMGPEPFRVGENDEWLGRRPAEVEMPGKVSEPFLFRDDAGKLKRQAARFRIYKCTRNAEGALCEAQEIRCGDQVKSIEWKVHLRNRKAEAACFDPSGNADALTSDRKKRNATIKERGSLVIDPGARTLCVEAVAPTEFEEAKALFDTGTFLLEPVDLGEMRTDIDGRLLVIGGKGRSFSRSLSALDSFTDNDDWCDDTSDGPVTAKIVMKDSGEQIDVVPSWVIVAPPDFAPDITSFVTLYDICWQAWMDSNGIALPRAEETNFYRDVLPILRRTRGYRWVFAGVMRSDVPDKHGSWSNERSTLFAALADPSNVAPAPGSVSEKAIRYRQMLVAHLRDPDNAVVPPREVAMPRLHDDHKKKSGATGASEVLALTRCQYRHMRNWADGTFTNNRIPVTELECDALDRIALQACSGGAFYPGMEASRIMKDMRLYTTPFRIDPCSERWRLESAQEGQPVYDVEYGAGRITEGLAVPWQADFYECRMDGDATWWPATHPDKVLVVRSDEKNMDQPADALSEQMELWHYGIGSRSSMVKMWSRLGIVKAKQLTIQDGWGIPATAENAIADGDGKITSGTVYVEEERIEGDDGLPSREEKPYSDTLRVRSAEKRTVRAKENRERTIEPGSS
jgi:hypothetical protein